VEILPAIAPGEDRRKVMAELESRIETATAALVAEAPVDNYARSFVKTVDKVNI